MEEYYDIRGISTLVMIEDWRAAEAMLWECRKQKGEKYGRTGENKTRHPIVFVDYSGTSIDSGTKDPVIQANCKRGGNTIPIRDEEVKDILKKMEKNLELWSFIKKMELGDSRLIAGCPHGWLIF